MASRILSRLGSHSIPVVISSKANGCNFKCFTRTAVQYQPINSISSCSIRSFSVNSPEDPIPGDASNEPFIPAYQQKENEPVSTLRARLLYQSRKRGMLENGLLLSTFAAKFLNAMSETELREYDRLINLPSNDWDLYYWATGVKPVPKEFEGPMLQKFMDHVRNADRENRTRQPDLA